MHLFSTNLDNERVLVPFKYFKNFHKVRILANNAFVQHERFPEHLEPPALLANEHDCSTLRLAIVVVIDNVGVIQL